MRRLALALFVLCACSSLPGARAPAAPAAAPPSWVSEESVYVDPNPAASLLWGSEMERGALKLRDLLQQAGMKPGARGDPKTLFVKLTMSGLTDFVFAFVLERGGAVVEEGSFSGSSLPCWTTLGALLLTKAAKVDCAVGAYADRILGSRILAVEHRRQAPEPAGQRIKGRLAVLDLRNLSKEMSSDDAHYFTDLVRAAVLKYAPQLEVITRENLLVLLQASGKDLASCEGECEVDTGRRIGADAIISGEIQKVGTRYKIGLRLHQTRDGRLAAASVASGQSIDELDDSAGKAVASLFDGAR